ncbi:uncharacterized protein LOC130810471 isoform X2 [Amaranthus tricolor]|uniref:uncharacterized protein LOC130810471 isoform X2 n=1 Tax=Amaranthus tricolor TaxID=29722 RepID=UPI002587315D|nr:uncharacterized protein LOC130810471 isoform X2 [Amaranthus tricolor]
MSNVTSIWNGGSIYCVLFLRVPSSPKFNLLSFRRFVVLPPGIYFSHTSLHSHHFPITQTSNFSIFLKWVFFKILSFPSITDFYSCLCSYVWLLPSPNFHSLLKEQEEKLIERALIGSRPPRCEGRCNNCGHCEAIQVPIVPQQGFPRSHFMHSRPTIAYSRGDSLSNYKPMSWKCKCGHSIFNP